MGPCEICGDGVHVRVNLIILDSKSLFDFHIKNQKPKTINK